MSIGEVCRRLHWMHLIGFYFVSPVFIRTFLYLQIAWPQRSVVHAWWAFGILFQGAEKVGDGEDLLLL